MTLPHDYTGFNPQFLHAVNQAARLFGQCKGSGRRPQVDKQGLAWCQWCGRTLKTMGDEDIRLPLHVVPGGDTLGVAESKRLFRAGLREPREPQFYMTEDWESGVLEFRAIKEGDGPLTGYAQLGNEDLLDKIKELQDRIAELEGRDPADPSTSSGQAVPPPASGEDEGDEHAAL